MSEIRELYSVVDKSKKRRPVQQSKNAEDTLPHDRKKMLLKKKPLPYATVYRKNDDTLEVKSASAAEVSLPDISAKGASYEEPRCQQCISSPKCLIVWLLLVMICLVLTVVFALSVLAVASDSGMKSEIKALQEQLQALQQNASEEHSILRHNVNKLGHINSELSQNYSNFLVEVRQLLSSDCPYTITSCASLPPSCPSGYYLLATSTSAARVYCDMTRMCGNVTGGWMRVGFLNMTDYSSHCPVDLRQSNHNNIRTCIVRNIGCSSVAYHAAHFEYSRVCGRVKAYQVGNTNAFRSSYISANKNSISINFVYVDGVSLTYGNPRQHIWTFAAALDKNGSANTDNRHYCLCQNVTAPSPPSFVGSDYFCDSGSDGTQQFHSADPLWDGAGCEPPNTCCSFNAPPWFYKQLPQPTTDDIEMRVCRDEPFSNEDIAVAEVEIYVQ